MSICICNVAVAVGSQACVRFLFVTNVLFALAMCCRHQTLLRVDYTKDGSWHRRELGLSSKCSSKQISRRLGCNRECRSNIWNLEICIWIEAV